jgi:choice-of-anchor B domain-containing protein
MIRILLMSIFILMNALSFAQMQMNMTLLSRWDDDSIPAAWTGAYSECWGYVDEEGREYAFLASTQGTYFFEITDPVNPRLIDFIRTKDTTTLVVNKDYATFGHYLYAVSDQGDNSLQIFDLRYLPDSVVKAYDSDAISKRCHTIFIEKERMYMASNTRYNNSHGPMDIFSISDPLNPILLGTVSNPGFFTVHEAYVKNDTAYCANGVNGLWIYDLTNPSSPVPISVLDIYPEKGYNHSAWLTDDGRYMAFTDENHGKGVKIYDVTDKSDPVFKSIFRSNFLNVADPQSENGSVAHNPYIANDLLLISYYHEGVQAYDISDPANPELIGYFDTHPQNTSYYSYNGCWGLYPFLPSGNIIASDIANGLFIIDGSQIFNSVDDIPQNSSVFVAGNPVNESLNLSINLAGNENCLISLYEITGKLLYSKKLNLEKGNHKIEIKMNTFSSGSYIINLHSDQINYSSKILKTANK